MARFLIDANLPYFIKIWHNKEFIHVNDVCRTFTDVEIWNYAKENNIIILTKDADFTALAMLYGYPPKIIHFKIGNLRINDFYNLINKI